MTRNSDESLREWKFISVSSLYYPCDCLLEKLFTSAAFYAIIKTHCSYGLGIFAAALPKRNQKEGMK